MPYVEGESLRDRLDRDKLLPVEEAVQIAREVADALGYSHGMGVIHRDIKPENILLSGGHARVADFGIARAVSSAGGEKLTHTGTSVGTPLYMSPEQGLGDAVGPTSDLYSLGCVLYEMLAGTPPFTGPSSQAILARHSLDPVPALQTLRDTVPEEVEDAVLAVLNKQPADRPQSAGQFLQMLQAGAGASTGRHPGARSSTARAAAARRTPVAAAAATALIRRPPLVWAGGLVLVVLAALVLPRLRGGGAVSGASGPDRRHLAVLYFEDLSPKGELGFVADGLTDGLIDALAGVSGLSVVSRGGVAPYRGGTATRDSIARALDVGTLVIGAVEPETDSIRVTVRLLDDAGIELDRATFKQAARDLVGLVDSLPRQAARLIRQRLGHTVSLSSTRAGTKSTDAWAFYQRAAQTRTRGDSLFRAGDQAGFLRGYQLADSLAELAAGRDPKWVDPVILRGLLRYWRDRRVQANADEHRRGLDAGLQFANRALSMDAENAEALELRGNLRYWRWLLRLDSVPTLRKSLLASAQQDLEMATSLSPARAGAWASLSHLYYQLPEKTSVDILFAASKALELDSYLANAEVVYNRLTLGYYDAEKLEDSDKWCREARRRFPADERFVTCALWLALSELKPPNPARAWALVDTASGLGQDDSDRRRARMEGTLIVAGVLARAGLIDSARRVLRRTPMDSTADPLYESLGTRAYAWLLAGDREESLATLRIYFDLPANRRGGMGPEWWFRAIADDPRYQAMRRR
jgi:serine/threonine-protein kinase